MATPPLLAPSQTRIHSGIVAGGGFKISAPARSHLSCSYQIISTTLGAELSLHDSWKKDFLTRSTLSYMPPFGTFPAISRPVIDRFRRSSNDLQTQRHVGRGIYNLIGSKGFFSLALLYPLCNVITCAARLTVASAWSRRATTSLLQPGPSPTKVPPPGTRKNAHAAKQTQAFYYYYREPGVQ